MKLLLFLFFTASLAISKKRELYNEDSSSSEDDTSESDYDSRILDTKAIKGREIGVYPLGSKSVEQTKEKKDENSILRSKYWKQLKESENDYRKFNFDPRKTYEDKNLLWDSQVEEKKLKKELLDYFEDEPKEFRKLKIPKRKNADLEYYDEYLPENKMTYRVINPQIQQKYEEVVPQPALADDLLGLRKDVHLAIDPPKMSPSTPLLESTDNEEIVVESDKSLNIIPQQLNFNVEYPISSVEISRLSYPILPAVLSFSIDITDCVIFLLLGILLIWILKIVYVRYICPRPILSTTEPYDLEKGSIKKNGPM